MGVSMGKVAKLLLLAAWAGAHALVWGPVIGGRTSLVVSVEVGGREVGVVEALATEGGVCLEIGDFARLAGVSWDAGARRLSTPLGELEFAPGELLAVEATSYLCPETAKKRLGAVFLFDPAEVRLTLDLPWSLAQPAALPVRLVPEIRAPGWGLGTLRADAWMVREGDSETHAGSLTLTGRAVGGEFRVLADNPKGEGAAVREFFWQRRFLRKAIGVGRSWVQLSPLVSGLDFVGLQLAWSNEPLPKLSGNAGGVLGQGGALRTFRGPAPPGSLVRLKLDGVVVASQLVGVSGRYEFLDVPVAGRGAVVVEVEIFDRHNLLVPVEVRREVASVAAQVLPAGRWVQLAGAGWGGVFGRKLLGDAADRDAAAFYALRYAPHQALTLELALQALGKRSQGSLGFLGNPRPWWFVAAEVAGSSGGKGLLVENQLFGKSVELSLRALYQERGFPLTGSLLADRHDYSAELRFFLGQGLELGVWGRDVTVGREAFRWVRPTLAASFRQWLFLRLYPDQQGDMTAVLLANPHPRLRIAASSFHTKSVDAFWQLGEGGRWFLRGTHETGGGAPSRTTLTLGRQGERFWAPAFRIGVAHSGQHTGPYLEVSSRIAPGLWLRGEYQGVPGRVRPGEPLRSRLYLSLTADYAYASGLFTPTGGLSLARELGAIAGRLRVSGSQRSLAGARVVVVGVGGAVTDAAGRFFLGSVPPGVYEVYLDPENLPLELSPKRTRAVVEVLAGVTTRVDFLLEELFGFAGQVRTQAGDPLPGVELVVRDARGQERLRTRTDAFGLYRVDQLPRGSYRVEALGPSGELLAARTVELAGFLFAQDLTVGHL
jgi:hypothetical protein